MSTNLSADGSIGFAATALVVVEVLCLVAGVAALIFLAWRSRRSQTPLLAKKVPIDKPMLKQANGASSSNGEHAPPSTPPRRSQQPKPPPLSPFDSFANKVAALMGCGIKDDEGRSLV